MNLVVTDRGNVVQRARLLRRLQLVDKFVQSVSDGSGKAVQRRNALGRVAFDKLHNIWRRRAVSNNAKTRPVESFVFSVSLYGCELWTVRIQEEKRIDALEMWCWRRLLLVS